MFDPRKLMPFSIEYCNAPIAVMTEITEKTPMVMPSIVSAERSLFAPSDDHAILMISLKSMSQKSEYRISKSETNSRKFKYRNRTVIRIPGGWHQRYSLAPLPQRKVADVRVRVRHRHQASAANRKFLSLLCDKS